MERLNAEPLLEDHVFPLFTSLSRYSFHIIPPAIVGAEA